MAHAQAQFDRPNDESAKAPARSAGPRPARDRARRLANRVAAAFPYLAALADGVAIFTAAAASAALYEVVTLGRIPEVEAATTVGLVVAAIVVVVAAERGQYGRAGYATRSSQFSRALAAWNFAFLCALALLFATRTSTVYSRGAVGVFYLAGFLALFGVRRMLVVLVERAERVGWFAPRRVVVVGLEDALAHDAPRVDPRADRLEIAATIALRDSPASLADDLALAAATVRMLRPDDVYLVVPWARSELIEACFDAFLRTPTEIHLGGEALLDRFKEARIVTFGPSASLALTRPPLTRLQLAEKRAFDLVVASLGLILLAPFFLLVALAIRLESPGPALFRQTRYGFNQEPFRIFKFRTMRTLEDGVTVKAATRNDPRVTRLGALLRRTSVDELPQLLNVVAGDMSIVGPRPQAMAHDQLYVERIARYARRHNVKPGITGWAQVNGLRGEIRTNEDIQARVEHDLYYVDHWSLWLDLKIVLATALGMFGHEKAY
jgi:Undecaprenyl-phosphate glucose phosphotransferase